MWPMRTVHLDFHTGPAVPDVGRDFDPDEFAQVFKDARVQSVAVFAKCHHGHTYYDTARPERHPNLVPGLDLLGEQVDALHRNGILAPVYLSVQVDEYAANTHPDWLAVDTELHQVKLASGKFEPGWQILDMDSPYADYLADQLEEVMRHLGTVDGIFLDMCWDQESVSTWAVDAMLKSRLDPSVAEHRAQHARAVAHRYMERYRGQVLPYLSTEAPMSIWFNSRPKTALVEEIRFVDHVEIEALPTGGWGYSYFPYVARFVSPLGRPTLAHTGRFHKSWGDNGGLKPLAALTYECAQMMSLGVSATVGDLMPPRGRLQPEVYQLIGEVFTRLESLEAFVAGGVLQVEAAVLMDPALGDSPGPVGVGIVRLLQELRVQFCIVDPAGPYEGYPLLIVPETTMVTAELRTRLDAHVANGGALLLVGAAGQAEDGSALLSAQGIERGEPSPYSHAFLHPVAGGFDHVMYEPSLRLVPDAGSRVLYTWSDPFFERTWDHFSGHEYTAVDGPSGFAAVVVRGSTATIGAPLFTAYARHGAAAYRTLLSATLDAVLPERLVRTSGPAHLEVTVMDTDAGRVVHLVSFLAARLGEVFSPVTRQTEGIDIVNDPYPLVGLEVSIACTARPRRISLQPHATEVPFQYENGVVTVVVDVPEGHGLLVIELDPSST
jgi:Hypothetical glycosyl hydrolase 6/Beta-galactosidase trimerisation domain